ncbi:hypothetical protein PG911_16595 [Tenacibaculum ovolyticum]|uniref:hypothetical protein n=1 Tax=Tenacibaculum ovolyticum TaxID=104270 RepID=UPI0022F3FF56|nr:hypothetical protein [Tenacibaculum ovolyticum]WBX76223.1 hypothetical protein PG911_16595 [Tenacibaculum ovolyticum]
MKLNIIKSSIVFTTLVVTMYSCQKNEETIPSEAQNLISTEHLKEENLIGAASATPFNTGYYGGYKTYKMQYGQSYIEWAIPNLKWFFGVNPTVYNWRGANTNNMLAYSNPNRVFIGETWWNSMLSNYDAYAAKSIIAHEFGHILQYDNNWYWATGKNQEIGADFFAGYWLASNVGQNITWQEASNSFRNFGTIGNGVSHGSSTERQAAAKLGYYTGFYANTKGFLGWDKVYKLLVRYWGYIGQGKYWYDGSGYYRTSKSSKTKELYKDLSNREAEFLEFMMHNFNEILDIKNGKASKKQFAKFNLKKVVN